MRRQAPEQETRYCVGMPRKPNYGFEKRRKEQERQKKTEAKREEKLRRKQEERGDTDPEPLPPVEPTP